MLSFVRQPTILGSLSMYQRPSLDSAGRKHANGPNGTNGNGGGHFFSPPMHHEPLLRCE